MFAYCGNNPVARVDFGGEFWHILIGAAVGAIISGVAKVVSNAIEDKPLTEGLGRAVLEGAASGALSSTGASAVVTIAGNAAISMTGNAVEQVIENKGFDDFDVGEMLVDGAIGGISGMIGGAGNGTKHLTNLGKQTVKRTLNTMKYNGLKEGVKEMGKAFTYYSKNTTSYYLDLLKRTPADFLATLGTDLASP